VTIKGDIDNLGEIFQKGLEKPTFAKMASLSRQVNAFFALWLPWFCEHGRDEYGIARYRNTYTVFAGGDDFFLIGPWDSTLALATTLRERFAAYVANPQITFSAYVANPQITFSAGLSMNPPKTPIRQLARNAEEALAAAKNRPGKNAVTLWQRSVSWTEWQTLMEQRRTALEALMARAGGHTKRSWHAPAATAQAFPAASSTPCCSSPTVPKAPSRKTPSGARSSITGWRASSATVSRAMKPRAIDAGSCWPTPFAKSAARSAPTRVLTACRYRSCSTVSASDRRTHIASLS